MYRAPSSHAVRWGVRSADRRVHTLVLDLGDVLAARRGVPCTPCSIDRRRRYSGAATTLGSMTKPTGTAVMTMKDCRAEIPPSPTEINVAAAAPMSSAHTPRSHRDGESCAVQAWPIA